MKLLGNHKVYFNGVDLHEMGFDCVQADSDQRPIFAGGKSLTKSRAIDSMQYIATKIVREPITFTLSFVKCRNSNGQKDEEWTWEDITSLYEVFDVNTYKKLYFDELKVDEGGKPTTDEGYQVYYNVIPYIGNETQLYLFANNNGYVDITFECDAGNAWLDMETVIHCNSYQDQGDWRLSIPNISNVKSYEGNYRVYPYVKIEFRDGGEFCSFGSPVGVDTYGEWINVFLNLGNYPERQGCTVIIDGENQQYRLIYADGTEGDPSEVWTILQGGELRFLYLEKGDDVIYHRLITDGESQITDTNYPYTMTVKVAYPINIGGLLI